MHETTATREQAREDITTDLNSVEAETDTAEQGDRDHGHDRAHERARADVTTTDPRVSKPPEMSSEARETIERLCEEAEQSIEPTVVEYDD